jgi:dTDP-4-amino-4,6-dideoxygalactose transaminase
MRAVLAPQAPSTHTPVADQLSEEVINLPLSPDTERKTAEQAIDIIRLHLGGDTTP